MSKERYLIKVVGCVEPAVYGPFSRECDRSRAARKIHRAMDEEDTLFALDMFPVQAWAYCSRFFEEE